MPGKDFIMKFAKYLLLALLVFVTVFAFVACGNLGDDDTEFNEVFSSDAKSDYVRPLTQSKDFFSGSQGYRYTTVATSGDYAVFAKASTYSGQDTIIYEFWNVASETKIKEFTKYASSGTTYGFTIYDGMLAVTETSSGYSSYSTYSVYAANGNSIYTGESVPISIESVDGAGEYYMVRTDGSESFMLVKDGMVVTSYHIPAFFNFDADDFFFTDNYAIVEEDSYAVYYDNSFSKVAVYNFPVEAISEVGGYPFGIETYILEDGKFVFLGYEALHADDSWYDFRVNGIGFDYCYEIYDPEEDDTYDIDNDGYFIEDIYEIDADTYFSANDETVIVVEYFNVEDGIVDTSKELLATMDDEGDFVYDLSSFVEDQLDVPEPFGNGFFYVEVVGGYEILDNNGNSVKFVSSINGISGYDFGFVTNKDGVYTIYDMNFNTVKTLDTDEYTVQFVGKAAVIYSYNSSYGYNNTYYIYDGSGMERTISVNGKIESVSTADDYYIVRYSYTNYQTGNTTYECSAYLANGTAIATNCKNITALVTTSDFVILEITTYNSYSDTSNYAYKKVF